MTARPLYKVDATVSQADRAANLERRLATLHELLTLEKAISCDLAEKNGMLTARLHSEQARRRAAVAALAESDRNAAQFHALLIAERIKHLPARGNND